jgi:hypothetical protein
VPVGGGIIAEKGAEVGLGTKGFVVDKTTGVWGWTVTTTEDGVGEENTISWGGTATGGIIAGAGAVALMTIATGVGVTGAFAATAMGCEIGACWAGTAA